MNKLSAVVATFLVLLVAGSVAASATPKFRLTSSVSGGGPFGPPPQPGSPGRLSIGEPVWVTVGGDLKGADGSSLDNAELAAALRPCLLAGSNHLDHPEIAAGGPLDCLVIPGLTWSVAPLPLVGEHLSAQLVGTPLPAGEYTFLVVLEHPGLQSIVGSPIGLRSHPMGISVADATDTTVRLNALLRAVGRAEVAQNWSVVSQRAQEMLALHPKSVHALTALGLAQSELGNDVAALASYKEALRILDAREDVLGAVRFESSHMRDDRISYVRRRIGEIEGPDEPNDE